MTVNIVNELVTSDLDKFAGKNESWAASQLTDTRGTVENRSSLSGLQNAVSMWNRER